MATHTIEVTQRDLNYVWFVKHIGHIFFAVLAATVALISFAWLNAQQTVLFVEAVLAIAFVIWCRAADQDIAGRLPSKNPIRVIRRLIWKHFKLAFGIAITAVLVFFVFGEKGKSTSPGLEHPVEFGFNIVATVLAPIFLVLLILSQTYRHQACVAAVVLYLIWLVFTTGKIIVQEY